MTGAVLVCRRHHLEVIREGDNTAWRWVCPKGCIAGYGMTDGTLELGRTQDDNQTSGTQ